MRMRLLRLALVLGLAGLPACVLIDDFGKFAEGTPTDGGPSDDDAGLDAGPPTDDDAGGGCQPETCNGEDDDCDGTTDEEPTECSFPNAVVGCVEGACAQVSCEPGFEDCTDAPGCETDPSSDPMHCGSCGNACVTGQLCGPSEGCYWAPITDLRILSADSAQLRQVEIDPSTGDVVVAGSSSADGSLDGQTVPASGSIIGRFDGASTSVEWVRTLPSDLFVRDLRSATAGVTFVASQYNGTLSFAGGSRTSRGGTSDGVLLSYAADGSERSLEMFGGSGGGESLYAIDFASGRMAVAGYTTDAISGSVTPFGAHDVFMGLQDVSVTTPFPRQFGGAGNDRAMDIAISGRDTYSFVAWYTDDADFGGATPLADRNEPPWSQNFVVGAQTASGELLWALTAPAYYGEGGNQARVAADSSGNTYFAAGFWVRPPDFGSGPIATSPDLLFTVGAVSASGELLWATALDANVADGGFVLGTDGHLYTSGVFNSVGGTDLFGTGDSLPAGGETDCLVTSFDSRDGSVRWARTLTSPGFLYCYDIVHDGTGVWVVGRYSDSADFDGDIRTPTGSGGDGFLVRIEP
jgi:hypothetical protein